MQSDLGKVGKLSRNFYTNNRKNTLFSSFPPLSSFPPPSPLLRPLFGLASGAPEGEAKQGRTRPEEEPKEWMFLWQRN